MDYSFRDSAELGRNVKSVYCIHCAWNKEWCMGSNGCVVLFVIVNGVEELLI